MRIGVILFDREPDLGGGYTYEVEVLQSLQLLARESEHDFVVFSNKYLDPCTRPVRGDTPNVEFVAYPHLRWIARLMNKIRLRFDVVRMSLDKETRLDRLARDAGVEFLWFVGANSLLTNLPYLATVWDLQHRLQPWFPEVSARGQWAIRESFYSWFLQRAAVVVTGNQAGRKEIELFFQIPPERIRLLPHMTPKFALEQPDRSLEIPAKYGIPDDFLLYPAQFWPHKNHVNLLHAIHEIRENDGQILPVVFVGSDQGNLGHVKSVTSRLDLEAQIHFLGFIPREDLVALYQNALALVYVSFFGPENLPPMEAFGLGCPVIAARVEGAVEQFGDAALLVDPSQAEDIAASIRRLRDDPELRATLRERGFKKASEWTADDYVREMFEIFADFAPIRRCWGV